MDVREKLVNQLRDVASITPPICRYDNPYEIECFGKTITVYCKPFEQFQGLMRDAADYIAHGVTVQEWGGCKYCKAYEDLPEHFIDGKPVGRVFDTCIQPNENGLWHIEVPCGADIGIRFCPMCGRRLPQPPKGE